MSLACWFQGFAGSFYFSEPFLRRGSLAKPFSDGSEKKAVPAEAFTSGILFHGDISPRRVVGHLEMKSFCLY